LPANLPLYGAEPEVTADDEANAEIARAKVRESGGKMGFNWFWDRVSEKWIVSAQAVWLFGFSAMLICLGTALAVGLVKIYDPPGEVIGVLWGIMGIQGPWPPRPPKPPSNQFHD
jgi:hypothetical protein